MKYGGMAKGINVQLALLNNCCVFLRVIALRELFRDVQLAVTYSLAPLVLEKGHTHVAETAHGFRNLQLY